MPAFLNAITENGNDVHSGNSGVSAGSYTNANITVDAQGHVTAASNGSSGSSKGSGVVLDVMPPSTLFPALTVRVGASSPAEQFTVWAFDAATIEYLDHKVFLTGYNGGGLTIRLAWGAASATTGNVVWEAAIRYIEDDVNDIDVAHTYDYNSITVTAPTVAGEIVYDTITFTDGVDMDSWIDGTVAIVRIRRNASNASDTMTGDAQLLGVSIRET